MRCENAYRKEGVKYLLCKKAKEPDAKNMSEVAHAMCGFQRFCKEINNCTLLPTWVGCKRRDVNQSETAHEDAEKPAEEIPAKVTSRKKAAVKKAEAAE